MEFPWLQSRHNLHMSEILIWPHECKLLSGSHSYWSSRVIITQDWVLPIFPQLTSLTSHWRLINSSENMWILRFPVSVIASVPVELTSQAQAQQKVSWCQISNLFLMLWAQCSFLVMSWRDKNTTTVWEGLNHHCY